MAVGKAKGPSVTENMVNQGNIILLGETNGANNSNITYKVSVDRGCMFQVAVSKSQKKKMRQKSKSSAGYYTRSKFGFSAVYASNCNITRRSLWCDLSLIHKNHLDVPWSFIGDFNSIFGAHEHRGRHSPNKSHMIDFKFWTDHNNLLEILTKGAFFTWSNGRGINSVERKLDRAFCNNNWINSYITMSISSLPKLKSDHHPILLYFSFSSQRRASRFKFLAMWTLDYSCKTLISTVWASSVVGCPMFILAKKLKLLKTSLKAWNKDVFGNIHFLVLEATDDLSSIQGQINLEGASIILKGREKAAQNRFGRMVKIKRSRNSLPFFRDGNFVIQDPDVVANHVVNHFSKLFCFRDQSLELSMSDKVIPTLIDSSMNNLLNMLPSYEEIINVVFSLNKYSVSGPNSFRGIFFHSYWSIIKVDVYNDVLQLFRTGWLLPNFNAYSVIIIPKVKDADSIDKCWPLANFKFKIISKILADRLASLVPSLISKEQHGFIHGRSIRDCTCLTSEVVNVLENKNHGGNLALKIDISRAFELSWEFLLQVLV
ncbi:uncharacterized protein LOC131657884 [Vicia villosa]|uniref:uncharacterized protein LOC131657884 n=1 Tax=Vicia villosa TaxID=3911 RepID=UPI00273B5282|nr:uncharacterized protein LOC131657884 [Vicia villosa]